MIKKIRLHNWKSHKDSEFEFNKGTNVLTGIIGAGKSTVVEAMCYCLFGTYPALNSKSVALNEIIMNKPNQTEEAKVELEFDYNGKDYFVQRTVFLGKNSNQGKLLENGILIAGPKPKEVTEKIEEILEMDYDLFSRAVYSEQNQIDFFLKLSPGERKKKFDEILGLDRYEKARKTNVSVMNRIKKMTEDRKEMINKNASLIDENELKKLEAKKEEKIQKAKELEETKIKEKEELEKHIKEMKILEEKEKKFLQLNEKIIKAKSKITEAEKRFNELKIDIKKMNKEELETKLKELKKQKIELEKTSKELSLVQARIKAEKEKNEFLEKEKNRKKELIPKGIKSEEEINAKEEELKKELEKIRETVKGTENTIEENEKLIIETKKGISVNEKRNEELEENIKKLTKTESNCPVCSTKLSREKKIELINSTEKEQKRILIINKGLMEEEKRIFEEIARKKNEKKEEEKKSVLAEEQKNKLDSVREKLKELQQTEKEMELCRNKINELTASEKKLEAGFDEEKMHENEQEIRKTEQEMQCLNEFNKCREWKKELIEDEKEKNELEYKENSFSEKKEAITKINSSIGSLEKEIKNGVELIESIKENIERIEKEKNKIKEMKKEVEKQENGLSKLVLFNNALNETQSELRKEMIDTINEAMDDVWNRIYPYRDFVSAKMIIEEGNYEIKVKEKNGKWTRVEGILSGGERSTAAICIRVAFSLVLTQNLSWLILDEPTHNLDKRSVEELSKMMKEHLPNLVDQIFVITHDPEMEKAASGEYCEIERNKENEGSSIPKTNSIN